MGAGTGSYDIYMIYMKLEKIDFSFFVPKDSRTCHLSEDNLPNEY